MQNFEFELDEMGYVKNNIPFTQKMIHLESTDTYVKNKKRYRKSTFHFKDIIGFDTETYHGACKMICRSMGNNRTLYNGSFEDILYFLFYNARETKYYRFFWNLAFDVNAILKVWNDIDQIILLKEGYPVKYKEFTLSYLKGKLFSIRKGKKRVDFTDLWQFYKEKLDSAGFEFLGKRKLDNISGNRLNTDLSYWDKNYHDIEKYCLRDCEILRDLGLTLLEAVKEVGIELPRYLCSSASFSKAHFMKHSWIPSIYNFPQSILELAHYTYYGGRFEIFQRGYFRYLETHDINSQYPRKIRDLPSFRYGRWKKVDTLPEKETYGFYYVRISIPEDYKLPTIPIRHKGIIKFPNGFFEGWFTWYDLDLIREFILEVCNGVEYREASREYYPFKDEIDKLFNQKAKFKALIAELEKHKDKISNLQKSKVIYMLIKLTINALYGCFVEINEDIDKIKWGGRLFNPVNATFITAFGRWSVIKDIKIEDYDNIIGIHTDSVIFDKIIDYLPNGTELGLWNKEASGRGLIFGTGQYQIGKKVAIRSYSKKTTGSWFTLIERNKDSKIIKVIKPRMMKIAEALIRDKSLDRVNLMVDDEKEIKLNSDMKRIWDNKYSSFGQLLSTKAKSKPFYCIQKDSKNLLLKKEEKIEINYFSATISAEAYPN